MFNYPVLDSELIFWIKDKSEVIRKLQDSSIPELEIVSSHWDSLILEDFTRRLYLTYKNDIKFVFYKWALKKSNLSKPKYVLQEVYRDKDIERLDHLEMMIISGILERYLKEIKAQIKWVSPLPEIFISRLNSNYAYTEGLDDYSLDSLEISERLSVYKQLTLEDQ